MQRYIEKALFLDPSNWQALWYQVKLSETFGDMPKEVATLKEIVRYFPWSKIAQDKLRQVDPANAPREPQTGAGVTGTTGVGQAGNQGGGQNANQAASQNSNSAAPVNTNSNNGFINRRSNTNQTLRPPDNPGTALKRPPPRY